MDNFKDKVIIITGASSGIGAALAKQLARQGAKLVLAARNAGKLAEITAECLNIGGEGIYVETNVSNKSDCERLIRKTLDTFGRIDILVNNAGTGMWARFDELREIDLLKTIMEVNYLGSVYCTYYALKHLKETQGRIVIVNSEVGKTGVPTRTGYSASKHALNGFFDSLQIELVGTGVTVTSIYPGYVSSGFHEQIPGPDGILLGKDHKANYVQAMTPDDCAGAIIRGMAKRKREVLTFRLRFGLWLKLVAPQLVDRIASQAIQRGK